MDNTIILYLIKASISLALFYGLYMLFLKRDTFFKLRRGYFLFAMIFSLSFPFLSIEIPTAEQSETQLPTYWLSQIEIGEIVVQEVEAPSITIWTVVFIAVAIISAIFAFKFLIQLLSILKLRVANDSEKISSCHIVKLTDKKVSPFSFFNWIFVNSGMHSVTELKEIIAHEKVHVKQYHSIDVILAEIICICLWWNPFVWLLKNEMKINLEYLADQGVLKAGFDTKEYQYILLQVSNKNTGIPLINNFNVSQLKKRITMMNKKRTSIVKSAKYMLAIPLGAVLLLGNAVQASTDLMNFAPDELQKAQDETELLINNSLNLNSEISSSENQKPDDEKPFHTVEQMPSYPGGEAEMNKYIGENLKYPIEAQEKNIQGRVTIRFIVGKDGTVSDATVVRGFDPGCDAEALRVINAMPKWIPGKQKGKAVPVFFTLPIVFKLKDDRQTVLILNGKEISEADLKVEMTKREKEFGATTKKDLVTVQIVLPANEVKSKYGDKYRGKKVIEVSFGETTKQKTVEPTKKTGTDKNVFSTVEQMPSFPEGESALNKFISENLKYPIKAQEAGIQGRVTVRFIVTKTGELADVKVIRSIDPDLDKEAIRVINAMPKWNPGKQNGKDVDVYFILPIIFKLEK
ncbi:MAG: TonB family protein [Dysgonomonas sp.]